ncbi:MAG: DUF6261 family protein [Tannerellaceae bacterium]|jgi:hypothetical protein|nr:DUF6261 family protein [Tannerellaceae bacterium]
MKAIKSYRTIVNHLKNGEHFDFHDVIVTFVKARELDIPGIFKLWRLFLRNFEKEEVIYKRKSKAVETKYIREVEKKRKDVFMSIKYSVKSALYSDNVKKKEVALVLMEVIDKYKKIPVSPITEITTLVFHMIEELRMPRYSNLAAGLQLSEPVATLEALNERLKALYVERVQHAGEYDNLGTMKKARVSVDRSFRNFTDGINAVYAASLLDGDRGEATQYSDIIDFVNSYIDQYIRIRSHHTAPRTTAGKGDDEATEPQADDDNDPSRRRT